MIGVMILTHETLGKSYTELAEHFFGRIPQYLSIVGMQPDDDPDAVLADACRRADGLDSGSGVLVLADIFGATPCNVGRRLLPDRRMVLLTGLNAPMVVKALQYAPQSGDLNLLAEKVRQAGLDGIMRIEAGQEDGGGSC